MAVKTIASSTSSASLYRSLVIFARILVNPKNVSNFSCVSASLIFRDQYFSEVLTSSPHDDTIQRNIGKYTHHNLPCSNMLAHANSHFLHPEPLVLSRHV